MGGITKEIEKTIQKSQEKYETEIEVSLSTKPSMMKKKHKNLERKGR